MSGTRTEPLRKSMVGTLKKGFKKSNGRLIVRGYFTSDNVDEVGDIITRGATERALPKYRQWGNIRLMHQPKPVGKVISIGEEGGLEWNEVELEVIDPEAIFMVENGLLVALSVGILVNWEDVTLTQDGGMIINDYQFAEISLVDHPANYDATLKDAQIEQGLRYLARQYGFRAVAEGMQTLLNRELNMTDTAQEEQIVEEAQIEEPAEIEASLEPEAEKPEAQEEPAEEAEALEQEEPAEEEQVEEEVIEQPEEEPAVAEDEVEIEAQIAGEYAEMLVQLKELTQAFKDFASALQATLPKALQADEQGSGSEQVEVENSLEGDESEPETGSPAERSAAVPETQLPEVGEEKVQVEVKNQLRESLRRYLVRQ